jgi:hypothetical protein
MKQKNIDVYVYVVWYYDNCDGTTDIEGIFSTKELAEEYIGAYGSQFYSIQEVKLDENISI